MYIHLHLINNAEGTMWRFVLMNYTFRDPDKLTMTYTGLLQGKKGKVIHVSFERNTEHGRDYAELVLPSRKILHANGFNEGELVQLQLYLKTQEKDIIKNAKQINHDLIFKL